MALDAGGVRIVFNIHEGLMNVLMAFGTFQTYLPEAPSVILFMTGKTGCCQVSTFKRKRRSVMLLNGKTGTVKSKD